MLASVKIVLVETSHPGNIGGAARAMKNMGLSHLSLVQPKIFPCAEATARASGADDILAKAEICSTLQEAILDCNLIFGASARYRSITWPSVDPRNCPPLISELGENAKAAFVFGRENSGLNNDELDLCNYLLHIPCNPKFSSLNLVTAVQIISYELFLAFGEAKSPNIGDQGLDPPASSAQMEAFYTHLQETLGDIGFLHPDKSHSIMRRLRRIYNRIQLDTKELDILRGILRFSQNHNQK